MGEDGKESAYNARNPDSIPGSGRCPGEGNGTHSSILPGKFHGQRSLVDYSPWGDAKSLTLLNTFHFHLEYFTVFL